MLATIFGRVVYSKRKAMIGWSIGFAVLTALTVAFYPAIRDQSGFTEVFEQIPSELLAMFGVESAADFLSPVGYVNSQLFAQIIPIMFFVFAIGLGAAAIAGEENDGTMDVLLAQPVHRDRVVLEKFAAMVTLSMVLAVPTIVVLLISNAPTSLNLSVAGIIAASVGAALVGLVMGTIALAVGAFTGRRGLTIGVASGVAVATFFVFGLAPLIDFLEPLQKLTPFYYYLDPNPLEAGFTWHVLVQVATIGAFLGVAIVGFRRRDVTT